LYICKSLISIKLDLNQETRFIIVPLKLDMLTHSNEDYRRIRGRTAVEQLTHDPMLEGLISAAAGTGRNKQIF
jgi:hypothetical protein